jgi:hypothetical protein
MKHSGSFPSLVLALLLAAGLPLVASDHSDVPSINGLNRQDANLTDLHAFTVGDRLSLRSA